MTSNQRNPLGPVNNNSNNNNNNNNNNNIKKINAVSRKSMIPNSGATRTANNGTRMTAVSSASRKSLGARATSLGPQNINKVAPFQSSSKHLIQGGRESLNRRSSSYSYNIEKMSDCRPIKDKSFIQKSIQQLVQFLTCYNYEKMVSAELLHSPSSKDFFSIVEFLFRTIDSNFVWTKKVEEETPHIFKSIRYPFQLSSRSLSSVGTQYTWPSILAALNWLTTLLIYNENNIEIRQNELLQEENWSPEVLRESFFIFTAEAYSAFMSNNDSLEQELENKFIQNMMSRNQILKDTLQSKRDHTKKLLAEIKRLSNSDTRLANVKQEILVQEKDINKYKTVIASLEEQTEDFNEFCKKAESALKTEQDLVDSLDIEIRDLEERLTQQLDKNLDVDRLTQEHRELETAIKISASHRTEIEKHNWKLEMLISEQFNFVEKDLNTFNQLLRESDLVKYFNGELCFNPQEVPMFSVDLHDLKPRLKDILKEKFEQNKKLQQDVFQIFLEVEQSSEKVQTARTKLKDTQRELEREYLNLEKIKKQNDEEKKVIDQQIQHLRSKVEELTFDDKSAISLRETKKLALIQAIEDNRTKSEFKVRDLLDQHKAFKQLFYNHKKYITENFERLELDLKELVNQSN